LHDQQLLPVTIKPAVVPDNRFVFRQEGGNYVQLAVWIKTKKEKKSHKWTPGLRAIVEAIRERSKEDPLVGAKIGAKEIFNRPAGDNEGMKREYI
jgi:hypothetical protein